MKLSKDLIKTRGTVIKCKLVHHHCHYDVTKFNFTNHIIPYGTVLSSHVVSADTVNTFKNRLDEYRSNQDVLYNYRADRLGIGNCSIVT